MVSPANIKSQLVQLEDQKNKLQEESRKASQRLKWSVMGVAVGVLLLPLTLFAGILVLLIAGFIAVYFSIRKSSLGDKLETLESEIHKLEISMA